MKIIDKTPFVDEKGELGFSQRLQGMLQFGFNWPNELAAQKAIVTFFDRQLEKGYTLIRNMTLGASGIMIPLILLGPAGIFVIEISYLRGRYEARGDSWNAESGNQYKPAPVNLIKETMRKARALQIYIERQGVKVPVTIEPVLIAGEPGLQIESVRPAIRVVMIDGIKSFVSGLLSGQPMMRADSVFEMTERITNPRPPKKEQVTQAASVTAPRAAWEQDAQASPPQDVSRARSIFDASAEAKPFNPADFDFAMSDEEPPELPIPPVARESSPAQPLPQPIQKSTRILGMTRAQLAVIAALGLALLCILAIFVYIIVTRP